MWHVRENIGQPLDGTPIESGFELNSRTSLLFVKVQV
jgi:hypothetical protein